MATQRRFTPNPAAFESLRTTIDTYARGEATLREAWTKRYPTAAAFDVFAEKQLFQFAPSSKVFGIEAVDERIKPGATLLELLAIGSAQPDDDWRNRERLAYDDKRQPLKDKFGQAVPADPSLLNMGRPGPG